MIPPTVSSNQDFVPMHAVWDFLTESQKTLMFYALGYDRDAAVRMGWRSWESLKPEHRQRIRAHFLGQPNAFDLTAKKEPARPQPGSIQSLYAAFH
jgi:hypothetical protein